MAYAEDKTIDGLDAITSIASDDVRIVGDTSDSDRAKKITRANELIDNASATQTLTNKTMDADSNTVSNIGNEEIKAGVDAVKLADGTVTNTELQYINSLTSNAQTQISAAGTPEGTAIKSTGEAGAVKFLREDGDNTCSWQVPAGSGDVSKVGTPADNQVGVWTGDGTIEGTAGLTYDGANFLLVGDIGATGSRITKGWFTDLQVTNAIAGSVTGNAGTVTTITGLAPDTATTQATQAAITTCANLVTVGALNSGSIASGFGAIDNGASAITTTGTVSAGNVTVGDAGKIELDVVPASDVTGTGVTSTMTVDANTVGVGSALHLDTDGNWIEADANVSTAVPCQALAVETGTGSKQVLHYGVLRNDAWTWTVGGTIYLSTTVGTMTQTAPSATDDFVQVLGYATHADRMFFNPQLTLIKHA